MSHTKGEIRLTDGEYDQLRRATETYREELLVRLCGEVGLRASEIPRVRPTDVITHDRQARTRYFLTVRETESVREAYLPSNVAHDFWQYVRSNEINSNEPVIEVSARRIQMLVSAVGHRAAEETGRAALRAVTPSLLRQYFARKLLIEDGINPRVVTEIGGWTGVDGLLPTIEDPGRDEIVAAFERATDRADRSATTGRLRGLVAAIDRIGEALSSVGSQDDIEQSVCSALVEDDTYDAAWVTDLEESRDRVTLRAHAGADPDRFDGSSATTLIRQAGRTERVLVAPDRPQPGDEQDGLLAAVPLVHGESRYGVLVIKADSRGAFDDPERTLLADLGRRVGLRITATERRRLLVEDTRVQLTVEYEDENAVLITLTREMGCTASLAGIVTAEQNSVVVLVQVKGASSDEVINWASDARGIGSASPVRDYDDGALVEIAIEGKSPILPVVERGGVVQDIEITGGQGQLVVEFAPTLHVRSFVEALRDQFPSTELRSKEEVTPTERTPRGFREAIDGRLTEKQQSVLQAAYHAGYFEWPRGSTAEELAEAMNISSPTLHNHLRRAQQKLLGAAFDK
jgi:hypothetical protein